MPKLTLIGMFNTDNTLFDGLTLPIGIDKDTAIDSILLRGGEFETLYADTVFMKRAISFFSKKYSNTFKKWQEALTVEFSPIENYDRYEESEDTVEGAETGTSTSNSTTSYDTTETTENENTSTVSGSEEVENTKSSFDSSTYQPNEKSETTYNDVETASIGGGSTSKSGSDTVNGGTDISNSSTSQTKHTAHLHGNIGVTESTTMAEHYISFYGTYNIYELIADVFCSEFTIAVY